MKQSLEKLQKILNLEAERGYDNHAVLGGMERILDYWEGEARSDELPEELIRIVVNRVRDYSRLTEKSRAEIIQGLLKRLNLPDSEQTHALEISLQPDTGPSEEIAEHTAKKSVQLGQEIALSSPIQQEIKDTQPGLQATHQPQTAEQLIEESVDLGAPVTTLLGIGPRHAQALERLGVRNLRDMLYYFPRRYDDYSRLIPINRLSYGDEITVIGNIERVVTRTIRSGKFKVVEAIINDGSGSIQISWFNQVWMAKRLKIGENIVVSGKVEQYLGRLVMNNPEWEPLDQQQINTNRIVPVYGLTTNITQQWLRRQMNLVATQIAIKIKDPLPENVRQSTSLIELSIALNQIHFPDSWDDLHAAQERLAFDEIFLLQLGVIRQKNAWQERTGRIFRFSDDWIEEQIVRLPFPLTSAQNKALEDVRADLGTGHPMNRLLQGDVGSGKTVIAALAIAMVVSQGAQAALMAPTSILAEQHYNHLIDYLNSPQKKSDSSATNLFSNPLVDPILRQNQIRLLIGATPQSEKEQIRDGLANGEIKFVVGTHALIEDPVNFSDLQLAIVDEQHRFGVEQRASLRSKGENPHLFVMTATPIPRSLSLTIYGDLDISVMDEIPPGRKPVNTFVLTPHERERAYTLIRKQVELNHQAFIIYPLVEESDQSEAKAAVEEHNRLQNEIFPDLVVGLLHGRMRPDEKDSVMTEFRNGAFQILVSTSVVEVGVDIPNATVMMIEGANRFGLAQLHQFRGRVGRGDDQAYCLLIPDTPDRIENERLQAMIETNDGFILAERDLEQRGPGQFLGTRQSGFPDLKLANLTNVHLIEKARRQAQILIQKDPQLSSPEHNLLAITLQHLWRSGKGDIS